MYCFPFSLLFLWCDVLGLANVAFSLTGKTCWYHHASGNSSPFLLCLFPFVCNGIFIVSLKNSELSLASWPDDVWLLLAARDFPTSINIYIAPHVSSCTSLALSPMPFHASGLTCRKSSNVKQSASPTNRSTQRSVIHLTGSNCQPTSSSKSSASYCHAALLNCCSISDKAPYLNEFMTICLTFCFSRKLGKFQTTSCS